MKKIKLDPSKCVGCGFCANACPKFFELRNGKSHIIGSKMEDGKEILEVDDLDCAEEAANICPMKAIEIEK